MPEGSKQDEFMRKVNRLIANEMRGPSLRTWEYGDRTYFYTANRVRAPDGTGKWASGVYQKDARTGMSLLVHKEFHGKRKEAKDNARGMYHSAMTEDQEGRQN
jgi:hypothetical protein